MKLDDLPPKYREQAQKQFNEETAHRSSKPMGGLDSAIPQQDQVRPLVGKSSALQSRKRSVAVVVTFIPILNRHCDEDNYGHSQFKSMRDAISREFGVDDADERLLFEYARPVITKGHTGTQVVITVK